MAQHMAMHRPSQSKYGPVAGRGLRSLVLALVLLAWALPAAEEPSLFEEALSVSKRLDPDTDTEACRRAFAKLVEDVRTGLKDSRARNEDGTWQPRETVAVLNRVLLTDRKVTYISNKYWRDSLFTSPLIKNRGNCLATSLLYYLVARELDLPIRMAFMPMHAYARWDDGAAVVNIETTHNGIEVPDDVLNARLKMDAKDLARNGFLAKVGEDRIRAELLRNWSQNFYSLGDDRSADELLVRAARLEPDNIAVDVLCAKRLHRRGKIEEAGAIFRKLAEAPDRGPYAHALAVLALADFLESQGRADEAIRILMESYVDAPWTQKIEMIEQLGVLYRHKRDFKQAVDMHYLHAKLDPGEGSFNDLGSALTEAHRDAEAVAAYEKALSYNPENFFTQVILAGLYERSGDKEKGRAYFAKIEEPRANKITWYCALVWYYANIKEESKMLDNMKRALELEASGHVYQYFVREPDLDPYRKVAAFKALMQAHAPKPAAGEAQTPAEAKKDAQPAEPATAAP